MRGCCVEMRGGGVVGTLKQQGVNPFSSYYHSETAVVLRRGMEGLGGHWDH